MYHHSIIKLSILFIFLYGFIGIASPIAAQSNSFTGSLVWEDEFTNQNSRWNWTYSSGTGYKTIDTYEGYSVLRTGITQNSNTSQYSDNSLHEHTPTHSQAIVEMRLKTTDNNGFGDQGKGSRGWGFWDGNVDLPDANFAWFWSASPESGAAFQNLRAQVVRDGQFLFNQEITGIDMTQWHTYAVEMTDSGVVFYVDNQEVAQTTATPQGNQRIEIWIDNTGLDIVNNQVQQSFLDVDINQEMYLDFVRVYQPGIPASPTPESITASTPGNCNGDNLIDAGDISALGLELTDSDGYNAADISQGSFSGNPGCDANQDGAITQADIDCTNQVIFGDKTCTFAYTQFYPGDCNGDNLIDAGDLSALTNEIYDGDGEYTHDVIGGSVLGTYGCDANRDGFINTSDNTCISEIIFGNESCSQILPVRNSPLGDCNGDTRVDAGDSSALALELADGDGRLTANISAGTFFGYAGCDANQDGVITEHDSACINEIIFGDMSCTGQSAPTCSTDINQDGIIDLTDYSLLALNFLSTSPSISRADISQDGIVDLTDYSLLAADFLQTCP